MSPITYYGEIKMVNEVIENRVDELMAEGKQSKVHGWDSKVILTTIVDEFGEDAYDQAWSYIKHKCGVKE